VSENELLRKIFVPKIEKVGGARRKLHNKELNNSVVEEPEGGHLKTVADEIMILKWIISK
jgi:hypothetical protein